jgi:hypothetical protein
VITDNTGNAGGGIDGEYGAPVIVNCLIARNHAAIGAGVFASDGLIWGCTIVDNQASSPSSAGVAGPVEVHNSILWANDPNQASSSVTISYSDVQGGWPGTGNIDADPLFVDAAGGDYHLQANSPCIDTGDPAFFPQPGEVDLDGQRRLWDGDGDGLSYVDMGVDEYGSFVYGDLNCDGAVDFGDINPYVLALTDPAAYGTTFPACDVLNADINGDGGVDFGDINPFVALLSGGR